MTQLLDNLAAVRGRIDAACSDAGRDPAEVLLLPVSKTHPAAALRAVAEAGYRLVGENKVQEMVAKATELGPDSPVRFAIIGPLQRNKARRVAELADQFQALDSIELARALSGRLVEAGRELDVLVQVNSSGEPTKSGVAPADAVDLARQLVGLPGLRVRGLMTLAAFSPDQRMVAACFDRMRRMQDDLRTEVPELSWDELSMGMSGDFELAIAHGATIVRVGTAIFGPRG